MPTRSEERTSRLWLQDAHHGNRRTGNRYAAAVLPKLIAYARSLLRARSLESWKPFRLERGLTVINRNGQLSIGDRAHVWPDVKISMVGKPGAPARVEIGPQSSIGDRTQIHACNLVRIGARVMISWDVTLLENNYHADSKGPIVVEDDVWIGCRAIILSGVTVGRGAVVAAGAVVTRDVAPHTLVGGNPAKVLREITAEYRRENGMVALDGV
jgi:acetyltransferase-like isoleucine patch superfamily enzyme